MNKVSGILSLLVAICVGTALLNDAFVSVFNMENGLRWSALFGIIGIGVAFVIITGGIDLSIGSMIGLTGCLLPMLLVDYGWPVTLSLAAVLFLSLGLGLTHGLLITKLNLQPFIVTLCGLLIYRGLARTITGDQTKGFGSGYDDSLRLLAIGKPCSVAALLVMGGILLLAWSIWNWWRPEESSRPENRFSMPLVGVLVGAMLLLIGSSRFWTGWEVATASNAASITTLESPEGKATISSQAASRPGRLMRYCGLGLVPGLLWLGATLRRGPLGRMAGPVLGLLIAAGILWYALWLVAWQADWFWPHAGWARTWRIVAVFTSLAITIAALSGFARRSFAVGGPAAIPPLVLMAASAVLWLLGQTPLGSTLVPAPVLFLIVIGALASVFLNQTIYGRYLLALGNNEEAARFSGINTDRMKILAYVICSGLAGVGGVLFALDNNSIQPSGHGNFFELYAIAAAVLGGCSLRGGEGTIVDVVIGAAVMQVLRNSISLVGIPSKMEFAIIGLVILLGVLADEIAKRITSRRHTVLAARNATNQ